MTATAPLAPSERACEAADDVLDFLALDEDTERSHYVDAQRHVVEAQRRVAPHPTTEANR